MEERLWNSKGGLPRRKGTHSKRALHLVGGGGGGGGAQGAFQSSNRRPSTHRQPPLPEQQQQQLQQVYQDALRCCVFSILYSNSNELQLQLPLSSSTTAPALALALALAQTAGGGGAGASASNPPPLGQQQQQSSSKSSSFLKLTSKLKSSSSIAAATSSYSSSSESVLSPDNSTVILGKDAVRRFREDLETSINSIKRDLQSLPENLVNSCFVAAGERWGGLRQHSPLTHPPTHSPTHPLFPIPYSLFSIPSTQSSLLWSPEFVRCQGTHQILRIVDWLFPQSKRGAHQEWTFGTGSRRSHIRYPNSLHGHCCTRSDNQ